MRLIILISLILTFSISAFAQSDEDWDSKEYRIRDFSEIYLRGGYKVFLKQGDEVGLTVKVTDDDVFDHLTVENSGDELRLVMCKDYINYDRVRLYITFKELESLKVEGGLNLRTSGYLDLNDFLLHVEGGAKIEMDMKADDVEIIGEGGVLIELDGVADALIVKLSGAGHVDADELKARDVKFKIEGVGTGSVFATETLYAKIEGVGKIKYRGNPKVTKNIEGLGSVKCD
ncbi:MAG: head GIN domain-containing protein [Bacteroidota bacterium]